MIPLRERSRLRSHEEVREGMPSPLQGKAIMREQREGGEVLASGLIIWEDGAISELTAVDERTTCCYGDYVRLFFLCNESERLFIHRHFLLNQMQCPMDPCGGCRANPFIEHVSSTAKDQWINSTALPKDVEVPFWRMVQFEIHWSHAAVSVVYVADKVSNQDGS
ncbi:uncharacterized protein MONOS_14465 [Monocercomonoides exilis]|uniref:uncharacterized protein n=1 Tax=Monocercomonoides exilis TaxID=2049356 RepID=UPI00355950F1|nr:hypothetical protein MONOS_14465 [Monocercomonoides exilis]|eukprot:MONOS_14465.1-p1 / transcript=MONOS_14465.1 / gene=MONOS_14465 / organism=Monocercomonoides_exilis_PA203 / gene_product=unspecified product / transcript_product=unspecified product / location=Mono_scaffold01006:18091-18585(+) / protein_length=165 / sequence_SO=supercontig / SO=protein_coding / is_pseudo=false